MKKGFTLIELLVVVAILGILATVALVSFRTAQMRGRDAKRKSDLKQISTALELYYQDYRQYPDASGTEVKACGGTTPSACEWGESEMTDGKTTYIRIVPEDPSSGEYVYAVSTYNGVYVGDKYQLFAHLENAEDKNIIEGITVDCGVDTCNFAVTSPNTTATDDISLP